MTTADNESATIWRNPLTDAAAFLIDDADVPALRNAVSRIARAGYCETRVRERLGLSDLNDLRWRALPSKTSPTRGGGF
jgi:hypothetical protein